MAFLGFGIRINLQLSAGDPTGIFLMPVKYVEGSCQPSTPRAQTFCLIIYRVIKQGR